MPGAGLARSRSNNAVHTKSSGSVAYPRHVAVSAGRNSHRSAGLPQHRQGGPQTLLQELHNQLADVPVVPHVLHFVQAEDRILDRGFGVDGVFFCYHDLIIRLFFGIVPFTMRMVSSRK